MYSMWWSCVYFLLLCTTERRLANGVRHYDINTEAWRLYKEDFPTVLKKFRHTPEYLDILHARIIQLEHINQKRKIPEMINNSFYEDIIKENRIPKLRRVMERDEKMLRTFLGLEPIPWPSRRGDQGEVKEQQRKLKPGPVEVLDNHLILYSQFTVEERNSFKDVGFEVARTVIHALIDEIGRAADESEQESTRRMISSTDSSRHF